MKTKYDWSNVPKEVKWIAKDKDGEVWGYVEKPIIGEKGIWHVKNKYHGYFFIFDSFIVESWQDSLEERPQ